MTYSVQFYLDALKVLNNWSVTLLILQVVFFISAACICLFLDDEKLNNYRSWLNASVTFSVLSIIIALNVIGTLPWSIQRLPELSMKYQNIYQFPNYIGIPIWMLAFGQHLFFVLSLLCIAVYILLINRIRIKHNRMVL
jgi:hypothetical protein